MSANAEPRGFAGSSRFEMLDGLRGVAAFMVMAMHAGEAFGFRLFTNAGLAVDFFFILSGFVLCHAYGARPDPGLWRFMAIRLARLYPAFLLGLLLGVAALFASIATQRTTMPVPAALASIVANLLYLPFPNAYTVVQAPGATATGVLFPANPPYWSLFFELVANCAFFRLVALRTRSLAGFVLACLALLLAYGMFEQWRTGVHGLSIFFGWSTQNLPGGIPRVFYGFACGILVYRIAARPAVQAALRRRLNRRGLDLAMPIVVALLLGIDFSRLRGLYALGVIVIAGPVLVLASSAMEPRTSARLAAIRWLGWISYPLYCVHYPVVLLCAMALPRSPLAPGLAALLAVALAIGIAAAGARWFDEPLRRRWVRRRQAGSNGTPLPGKRDGTRKATLSRNGE